MCANFSFSNHLSKSKERMTALLRVSLEREGMEIEYSDLSKSPAKF